MAKQRHIAIQANVGRFSWNHRGQYGWFQPNGKTTISGRPAAELAANRTLWDSEEPLYAGRIFVGFNVGDEARWSMDDVVKIVRRVRDAQVHDPSSSFIYQRGLYSHHEGPGEGHVVDEEGAQIVLLNLPEFGVSPQQFERQMVALAEEIATELEQESVIVEIQRGGVSAKTIAVAGLE